jgi:hypothetical protein
MVPFVFAPDSGWLGAIPSLYLKYGHRIALGIDAEMTTPRKKDL